MSGYYEYTILCSCSAGIGRTGALLSAIIGVEMGLTDGYVDVLGIVNKLRKQRMKMIQTEVHNTVTDDSIRKFLKSHQKHLHCD